MSHLVGTVGFLLHINNGLVLARLVQSRIKISFFLLDITSAISILILVFPAHILLVGTLITVVVPLFFSLLAISISISLLLVSRTSIVGLLLVTLVGVHSLKSVSLIVISIILIIPIMDTCALYEATKYFMKTTTYSNIDL